MLLCTEQHRLKMIGPNPTCLPVYFFQPPSSIRMRFSYGNFSEGDVLPMSPLGHSEANATRIASNYHDGFAVYTHHVG